MKNKYVTQIREIFDMNSRMQETYISLSKKSVLLGSLSLHFVYTKSKVYVMLHAVKVKENARGKGLGSRLLSSAEKYLQRKTLVDNCTYYMQFTSRPSREIANAMYRKRGYTLIASATEGGTNLYQKIFTNIVPECPAGSASEMKGT